MELTEVKSIWQAYDRKLTTSFSLNLHVLDFIQTEKIKSKLNPLFRQRFVEILFHSAALILLSFFFVSHFFQFRYSASAFMLMLFYLLAFVGCLKQLVLIRRVDYGGDIVSLQRSLVTLQTHRINFARLSVLSIPACLAFPVVVTQVIKDLHLTAFADFDILAKSNGNWWNAQLAATLVLIPLGIWVYNQVSYRNIDKNWVKNFIQVSSGTRIRKALEFAKELEVLHQEVKR